MNLSQLSTEDLQALKSGDLSKVSTEGLTYLRGAQAKEAPAEEPETFDPSSVPHSFTPSASETSAPHQFLESAGDATSRFVNAAKEHPFQIIPGGIEAGVHAIAGGVGEAQRAVTHAFNPERYQPGEEVKPEDQYWYERATAPRTAVGKALEQGAGEAGQHVEAGGHAAVEAAPISEAAKTTIEENTPRALAAVSAPEALRLGVGTVRNVGRVARTVADKTVNAVAGPTAAQSATIASNPQIARARQAGFQMLPEDVRNAVNAPDSEIAGNRAINAPDSQVDNIQRGNRAHATQTMAQDVNLPNTRAIDPAEVDVRRQQAGSVYDAVGQSVGQQRPSAALGRDLDSLTVRDAPDRATQAAADAQLQFYREHYAGESFDGPAVVTSVRKLRSSAFKQIGSEDAGQQTLGHVNLGIANALEDELMRRIPVHSASLRQEFPVARTQLAKLHELEAVTEGGQVVPDKVLALHRNGAPLTGAAAEVANAADVAPNAMGQAVGQPAGQKVPTPTHLGIAHYAVQTGRKLVHALPGMDPSTEAFQTRNYGPTGIPEAQNVTGPPTPAQAGYNRGEGLTAPPGNAGPTPRQGEMALPEGRGNAPAFELSQPEGRVVEPRQRPLQGPHEPNREPMAQADWERAALERARRAPQSEERNGPGGSPPGPQPKPFAGEQPREGQLPTRLGQFAREIHKRRGGK